MTFNPRIPFRSRINGFDPKSKSTKLLRSINKENKGKSIPARFVSYNIGINQTVSVRFRILEDGNQYLEIGPMESGLISKAIKIK